MHIILIRHASTESSHTRIIGHDADDVGLSPEGVKEAELLRGTLPPFGADDAIAVSPSRRARETASILFPGRPFALAEGLAEIDKGFPLFLRSHPESARMTVDEWETAYRTHLGNEERYRLSYPSGVSLATFAESVAKAFEAIVTAHAGCGTLYVVTHNGPIRAIMSLNAGKEPHDAYFSLSIPYASFNTIER